ncbi:hypothetical protein COLO4_28539 [Corchorus olitorius]|uniref:Uncharacterized protein n=1 Tax=Corchorus olitorius TaxID=93759 RepID=A0A1R3HK29_9ROSI|nr:hypothetical protein COLO4_28539 [Corchorus olitorius]
MESKIPISPNWHSREGRKGFSFLQLYLLPTCFYGLFVGNRLQQAKRALLHPWNPMLLYGLREG